MDVKVLNEDDFLQGRHRVGDADAGASALSIYSKILLIKPDARCVVMNGL